MTNKKIQAIKPTLPKGGGAVKNIGETFQPDSFSGTGSYSIPIPTSSARGSHPGLAINYNSGSGNSEFGLGFSLSLPKISIRTEKGVPKYDGTDIFMVGGEELVLKMINKNGKPEKDICLKEKVWNVCAYMPRIEGSFSKIEHWVKSDGSESCWAIVTTANETLFYGRTHNSRIFNPDNPSQIFEWLIDETCDDIGNKILYNYKAEDSENISKEFYEQNRNHSTNRYIEKIQYGNYFDSEKEKFAFEVVFDYGEYDITGLDQGGKDPYKPVKSWHCRPDSFSSYKSGFEVRTHRLCHNILMFHHFKELGAPCLVSSVSLNYKQTGNYGQVKATGLTVIESVASTGYRRAGIKPGDLYGTNAEDPYEIQSLPPVKFKFSHFQPPQNPEFKELKVDNNSSIPGFLNNSGFQMIDLNGEGIDGLLYNDKESLFYFQPEGDGEYSTPVTPARFPIDKNFQLVDLESNGELELVVKDQTRTGYYQKNYEGNWNSFQEFETYPNNYSQPQLEMADLNANGKSDLLMVEGNDILVYQSRGKNGFDSATKIDKGEDFPLIKQNYQQEKVTFANIFGDGLSHRVKITKNSVECWPNLGYGKFGKKIILANAPQFDENFDTNRLFLTDIDGSGALDIVYVHSDRIELYLNQSGNFFSQAIAVPLPEKFSDIDQINFSDIQGNGTTCLVFTKIEPTLKHYYYNFVGEIEVDEKKQHIMKPHLLYEIDNNMGAVTRTQYCSSTKFYLEDKKAGKPWKTKLHFPVQVVEKVVTIDRISGARFTHSFKYHDGYYDHVEREFRGFGYVETCDTETYDEYEKNYSGPESSSQIVDKSSYAPPIYTRTWHHTGAFIESGVIDKHYKSQYFQDDKQAYDFPDSVFEGPIYQSDPETLRQAYVALKGHVMRSEVYARDQDKHPDKYKNPYTVSESNVEVKLYQERGDQDFAVFMVHARESIEYHYERNPDDPRISQSFVLKTDEFGNVLESCAISLPRRPNSNPDKTIYKEQQKLQGTVGLSTYVHPVNVCDGNPVSLCHVAWESQEFELLGLDLKDQNYFSFNEIKEQVETAIAPENRIPYEEEANAKTLQARQLSWDKTIFWDENQEKALPEGEVSTNNNVPAESKIPKGLVHHHENAVFTEDFIDSIYADQLANNDKGISTNEFIKQEGGYFPDDKSKDKIKYWWVKGLVQYYYKPDQPHKFYLPNKTENSFVDEKSSLYRKSTVDKYDCYFLSSTQVTTYMDSTDPENSVISTTNVEIDYITLQPRQIIDSNNNVAQVLFDPLGQVIVSSSFGTEIDQVGTSQHVGDMMLYPGCAPKGSDVYDKTKANNPTFDDVLKNPEKYLQGAADYFFYNLNAWQENQQPTCSISLVRENYFHAPKETTSDFACKISVAYADGFGRALEAKVKTDSGLAFIRDDAGKLVLDKDNKPEEKETNERWHVTGRTVYNNKGKPYKQYLPYFSNTPYYETQQEIVDEKLVPPPATICYDSLGRAVKTIHHRKISFLKEKDPQKKYRTVFSKVDFDPWQETHSDENDTIKDSEYYQDFMKNYPDNPNQQQKDDKDALDKAAKFYKTPGTKIFDSQGHLFLDIERKAPDKDPAMTNQQKIPDNQLISYYETDISGRNIRSIDPRLYNSNLTKGTDYYNFKYRYEMEGHSLVYVDSIDAGKEIHFSNVFGAQLWSLSPRNYCQIISYDQIGRQTGVMVKKIQQDKSNENQDSDKFKLVEKHIYGDNLSVLKNDSLKQFEKWVKDPGKLADDPKTLIKDRNLWGALYQLKDLSGVVTNEECDINGAVLSASRQITKDYKLPIDWNNDVKLEGDIYSSRFTHNAIGHLLTETTPDGSVTTNTYNEAGELETVKVQFPDGTDQKIVNHIEYDAKGQRTLIKYGNGVQTKYSYEEETLRLINISSTRPERDTNVEKRDPTVQDITYTYDPVGNITRTYDKRCKTVFYNNQKVEPLSEYTYDALYRLIQAKGRQHPGITADTGKIKLIKDEDFRQYKLNEVPHINDQTQLEFYTEEYTYDDSGNMVHKMHSADSATWNKPPMPVEDNSNRLKGVKYDDSGNMRQLDVNSTVKLTFNCCENLVKAAIIERPGELDDCDYYVYDSNEQRTRKVSERMGNDGSVTQIEEKIYLGNYEIKRKYSGSIENPANKTFERQTLRVMDDTSCVAIIHYITTDNQKAENEKTRQCRFQMCNHLGSVSLEMDKDAQLISYEEYFPYGGTAIIAGKNQAEVKLKEYRYSGKERDDSTGLYYYGARYYAPWLGRWLKPDPAGTVDGMNLYAFVGGNPVTHQDIDGMSIRKMAFEEEHRRSKRLLQKRRVDYFDGVSSDSDEGLKDFDSGSDDYIDSGSDDDLDGVGFDSDEGLEDLGSGSDDDLDAVGSDSDEGLKDFDSESDDDFEGVFSVGTNLKDRHVAKHSERFPNPLTPRQLAVAANKIHQAGGGDSRKTVVAFQAVDSRGKYRRFFATNKAIPSPGVRRKAVAMKFTPVHGVKAHAEVNKDIYLLKHVDDLLYHAHGCDKPMCRMCEAAEKLLIGKVNHTGERTGKYSNTYYHAALSKIRNKRVKKTIGMIRKVYTGEGQRKKRYGRTSVVPGVPRVRNSYVPGLPV